MNLNDLGYLYEAIELADKEGRREDLDALINELSRVESLQAQAVSQLPESAPVERVPSELVFPIEGGGIQKVDLSDPMVEATQPEVDNTLDGTISPEFSRDFMLLSAGAVNARSLEYNDGNLGRKVSTPREVLDAAIANDLLTPDFEPDIKFGAFKSQWDRYKQDMDPSMAGAFGRGAVSAIGSTAGGLIAGGLASPLGLGAIPVAALGAAGGGMLQESAFPSTSTDMAKRKFDEARKSTRYSRMAGEIAPGLIAQKPTFIGPNNIASSLMRGQTPRRIIDFTGSTIGRMEVPALARVGASAGIGGAIPAAFDVLQGKDIDLERVAQGVIAGGALESNSFGMLLHDRLASTTRQALELRNKVFQNNVANIPAAIADLMEARRINTNGVRLMSGEIVGGKLARLQRILRAFDDPRIEQRAIENERAISRNLASELAPEGAEPAATRAYAEQWQRTALAEADAVYAALTEAGETEYAGIIRAAMEQSAAAHAARETGVVSAELAEAVTLRNLEAAVENVLARSGTRLPAAQAVRKILKSEGDVVITAASKMFEAPKAQTARTDFKNTYKALRWSQTADGFGESGKTDPNISPRIVRRLLSLRKPRKDENGVVTTQHHRKVSTLISDYKNVNQAISEAQEAGKDNTVRVLMAIREGMKKDLDAAGDVYPQLQAANKAWSEAMKIYGDGGVLKARNKRGIVATEDTIDKTIRGNSGSEDYSAAQQLRDALKERPEGIQAVKDWFVNKLATETNGTYDAMLKWMRNPKQAELLDVFPEARTELLRHTNAIRDHELQVEAAKIATAQAKDVPKVNPEHVPRPINEAATRRRDAILAQAADIRAAQRADVGNNAFARFAGRDPVKAVSQVLGSDDPVEAMRQIVAMAQQDTSGEAIQGLRNALKSWMNSAVELNGRPITSDMQPDVPLERGSLALAQAKLNAFLKEGAPLRPVLEVVYGPDSVELRAMDMARKQIEIFERTGRIGAGSSPTADLSLGASSYDEMMQNNVLGLVSKLGRGMIPKGGAMNKLAWIGDLFSGFYKKNLAAMANQFTIDAMLDPDIAIEAMQPLTPENLPRANALLKAYFVSKDNLIKATPVLPFSFKNTKEEQIGEGRFLRDKTTGYRISEVRGKFTTYDDKGRPIGISETLQSAKDKAVMDDLKKLPPINTKKR